jgi:hypothetical protein
MYNNLKSKKKIFMIFILPKKVLKLNFKEKKILNKKNGILKKKFILNNKNGILKIKIFCFMNKNRTIKIEF